MSANALQIFGFPYNIVILASLLSEFMEFCEIPTHIHERLARKLQIQNEDQPSYYDCLLACEGLLVQDSAMAFTKAHLRRLGALAKACVQPTQRTCTTPNAHARTCKACCSSELHVKVVECFGPYLQAGGTSYHERGLLCVLARTN